MREADENLEQLEQRFTLYCVQLRRPIPRKRSKYDTSLPESVNGNGTTP